MRTLDAKKDRSDRDIYMAPVAGGEPLRPDDVQALPADERAAYIDDFAKALAGTFRYGVPLLLLGVVMAVRMREIPLRARIHDPSVDGTSFAVDVH